MKTSPSAFSAATEERNRSESSPSPTSFVAGMALILFLGAAVFSLYGSALDLYWTYDDARILKQALSHAPLEYFFMPSVWRQLSWTNLTPLVTFSFDIDHAFFGLTPRMFYFHHLAVLVLCAVLLYWNLGLWIRRLPAFAGACLFVIGIPLALVSQQLMVRHYVEGLLLASASFWFFVTALRSDCVPRAIVAALFFLGALSAKEIYAPLILFLLVVPEKSFRKRLAFAVPLLAVLVLYMLWRWRMLDVYLGLYSQTEGSALVPSNVLQFLSEFLRHASRGLWGLPSWQGALLASLSLICALALFIARPQSIPLVLWAMVLVAAPIVSIVPGPGEARLLVLPWLLITVVVVCGIDILIRESVRYRLTALVVVTAIAATVMVQNRDAWARHLATSGQLSAEGRFLVHHATAGDALRHTSVIPLDAEGLNWLRTTRYHGSPATVFMDDVYLCTNLTENKRVWEYRESSRRVEEITPVVARLTSDFCSALRYDVPLTVEASYSGDVPRFSWRFGPHTGGRYFIVIGEGSEKFELPRTGALKLLLSKDLRFRVRFDAHEGWTTYSPPLTLPFTQDASRLVWNRSGHGSK